MARPPLTKIGNQVSNSTPNQAANQAANQTVNQAAFTRKSRSYGGCKLCSVWLCVKGACFKLFHEKSNNSTQ